MAILSTGDDSLRRVRAAMTEYGYLNASEVRTAMFEGINDTGKEVHRITYLNEDTGAVESGRIFVWHVADRLVAEF